MKTPRIGTLEHQCFSKWLPHPSGESELKANSAGDFTPIVWVNLCVLLRSGLIWNPEKEVASGDAVKTREGDVVSSHDLQMHLGHYQST